MTALQTCSGADPGATRFVRPRAGFVGGHRRHRTGRLLAPASAILIAVLGATTAEAAPTERDRTAILEGARVAYSRPSTGARRLVRVAATRPITDARTTLPVLGTATDAAGRAWLQVLLPGRPNGRSGWIREQGTTEDHAGWEIRVRLGRRRVTVLRDGEAVRSFRVVVGARATPTPVGRFFVEETVRIPGGRVGGPYALALSARSNVLQEFDGGPGQIALHGRRGLGGRLGSAVSHGCLRLADGDLQWLSSRIGPGVQVTVVR